MVLALLDKILEYHEERTSRESFISNQIIDQLKFIRLLLSFMIIIIVITNV